MGDRILQVQFAYDKYQKALENRQHVGVAANRLAYDIGEILGKPKSLKKCEDCGERLPFNQKAEFPFTKHKTVLCQKCVDIRWNRTSHGR